MLTLLKTICRQRKICQFKLNYLWTIRTASLQDSLKLSEARLVLACASPSTWTKIREMRRDSRSLRCRLISSGDSSKIRRTWLSLKSKLWKDTMLKWILSSSSSSSNSPHTRSKSKRLILWSLISWRSFKIWMTRLTQCQTVLTRKALFRQITVLLTWKSQSRDKTGIIPNKLVKMTLMTNQTSLLLLMMICVSDLTEVSTIICLSVNDYWFEFCKSKMKP